MKRCIALRCMVALAALLQVEISQALTTNRFTHIAGSVFSGQVKMDTQLSHPCQRLIFIRTAIAQIGVLPSAVVEHLDIFAHIRSRLLARRIVALIGALAF